MGAWWLVGDPSKDVCCLRGLWVAGYTYELRDAMLDLCPVVVDDFGDAVVITGSVKE